MRHPRCLKASQSRRAGQSGASLIIVLIAVVLASLTIAGLTTIVNTNHRAEGGYRNVRLARYAGDGAIKQAVNWAKSNNDVAIDPDYDPASPEACRFLADGGTGTSISVDCVSARGSGSGEPAEGGKLPEDALVLTGDRHNEIGPYNHNRCEAGFNVAWDGIKGLFSGSWISPTAGDYNREYSLNIAPAQNERYLLCGERARTFDSLVVKGDVRAAGRIRTGGAALTSLGGTVRARHGCDPTPNSYCTGGMDQRVSDGRDADTDPGINVSASGYSDVEAFRFMRDDWRAVNFESNGTLTPGASMPARDGVDAPGKAYVWNNTLQKLEPTPGTDCTGLNRGQTIVFLPGWYRDARTFNRYTASPTCNEFTVWLAPGGLFEEQPSGARIPGEGVTSAFYLDFRDSIPVASWEECNATAANPTRWCIGGKQHSQAARTKVRVVTGSPKNWAPVGLSSTGAPTTQPVISVSTDSANTVDHDLSVTWHNAAGAKRLDDNNFDEYRPFCFIFCTPSSDRAIRVRDLRPKVTAGPTNGQLNLTLGYGIRDLSGDPLDVRLEVAAVTKESGYKDCGTYALPVQPASRDFDGTGAIPKVTLNNPVSIAPANAGQTLGSLCGSAQLINGMEITFKVIGNSDNSGIPEPRVWFDGAKVSYTTLQGASFPGATSSPVAPTDCDVSAPGAQVIFGGPSHVYIADGSLEICAGNYPTSPRNHMNIGAYGVPAVPTLKPTVTFNNTSGSEGTPRFEWWRCWYTPPATAGSLTNANRIGEPAGRASASFHYGNPSYCGTHGPFDTDGKSFTRANLTFPAYTVPGGYRVRKVEARVAYNSKNPANIVSWLTGATHAQLSVYGNRINVPLTSSDISWSNARDLQLYEYGGTSNKMTLDQFTGGASLQWYARGECGFLGIGCPFEDFLDGVELIVTLENANDANGPVLVPQSGCITAYPNYGDGEGTPDCAMIKADKRIHQDGTGGAPVIEWFTRSEGSWTGRVSVKGTIYAPSAALDVDDSDIAYPYATRGAVLRHLRIKGAAKRAGYTGPMVDNPSAPAPAPREAVFTACVQSTSRRGAVPRPACSASAGDVILSRSGVRFAVPSGGTASNVAVTQWWSVGAETATGP